MTLAEIEAAVKTLQAEVTQLKASVESITNSLTSYATKSELAAAKLVSANNADKLTTLTSTVSTLETSIGYVNKFANLLDVNITNLSKNDVLQYNGDAWTNIKPAELGIIGSTGSATSLSLLSDVLITNVAEGQALVWSNADGKWVNGSVSGGGEFDAVTMWNELHAVIVDGEYLINPRHINGQELTLTKVNTTEGATLQSGDVILNVNSTNVAVVGDFQASKEVAAFTS